MQLHSLKPYYRYPGNELTGNIFLKLEDIDCIDFLINLQNDERISSFLFEDEGNTNYI